MKFDEHPFVQGLKSENATLRAEVERLRRDYESCVVAIDNLFEDDHPDLVERVKQLFTRAERAEAERDRLAAVVREVDDLLDEQGAHAMDDGAIEINFKARAILRATPEPAKCEACGKPRREMYALGDCQCARRIAATDGGDDDGNYESIERIRSRQAATPEPKLSRGEACELARKNRERVDSLMAREVERDATPEPTIRELAEKHGMVNQDSRELTDVLTGKRVAPDATDGGDDR